MPSTRRTVLAGIATTSVLAVAGCTGDADSPSTPDPIDLTLNNHTDEQHEADVLIDLRDEALFDRTITLSPGGVIDEYVESPPEPGEATLSVALDGGAPEEWSIRLGPSTGLADIEITVQEDGSVSVGASRE
ncbi:hypothetical protein JCM30237_27120 [Halolamina litorea]|uniref:Ig-like domain-containing protein n=1 Tax=Halolamina litorea TaxID=1515593 RepID=A0ABD6BND3_9EURY|nr:hypothetical protein [Halolamina litorea]